MQLQMMRSLSLLIALFALWLLLSGHYNALLLSLGMGSCLFVLYIARRMDVVDHEGHPIHLSARILGYLPWLAWQIIKSNIAVAKLILHPRMPISPTVFTVHASQRGTLGKVIYANSITLTPGTVSMSLDNDRVLVHAIDREAQAGLMTGEMDRRVTRMARDI